MEDEDSLQEGSGRHIKTQLGLDGVFADDAAFGASCANGGDEVVQERSEVCPGWATGEVVFAVMRIAAGRGATISS